MTLALVRKDGNKYAPLTSKCQNHYIDQRDCRLKRKSIKQSAFPIIGLEFETFYQEKRIWCTTHKCYIDYFDQKFIIGPDDKLDQEFCDDLLQNNEVIIRCGNYKFTGSALTALWSGFVISKKPTTSMRNLIDNWTRYYSRQITDDDTFIQLYSHFNCFSKVESMKSIIGYVFHPKI